MSKSFKIRAAKPDDILAIGNLCSQLGYDVGRDSLQHRLDHITSDSDQVLRVATNKQDDIVGWVHALSVCYLEAETFIEIGGLVVDSSCRRLGIGRGRVGSPRSGCVPMQSVRRRMNFIAGLVMRLLNSRLRL